MWPLVTVEVKGNAPWVDEATRRMSDTKCACISPMEHNDGERIYIGISAGNWKQRLYNHRHSFSNPWLRNKTALFKYFWSLKNQGDPPTK